MKSFTRIARVPTIALLAGSFMLVGASPHVAQEQDPERPGLLSLSFHGGSAAEYVEAVRMNSEANIIADAEVADIDMPPIELTNASVDAALRLLHERHEDNGGRHVMLLVQEVPSAQGGANPIWTIRAITRGSDTAKVNENRSAMVWTVSELIDGGLNPADLLSAVEVAVSMNESLPAPEIKFHEATRLLIAEAHPQHLQTINMVIDEVAEAARASQPEDTDRMKAMEMERARLVARNESLEDELERLRLTLRDIEEQSRQQIAHLEAEMRAMRAKMEHGGDGS